MKKGKKYLTFPGGDLNRGFWTKYALFRQIHIKLSLYFFLIDRRYRCQIEAEDFFQIFWPSYITWNLNVKKRYSSWRVQVPWTRWQTFWERNFKNSCYLREQWGYYSSSVPTLTGAAAAHCIRGKPLCPSSLQVCLMT